jgi:NTP pyrophosphatase (non-canonical NTP hydrolase)
MAEDTLAGLTEAVRVFARERNWEQFHSPKNLAMALCGEVGELVAEFQWLSEAESKSLPQDKLAAIRDEVADVLLYLVNLSLRLGVDPVECATRKLAQNALRYPVSTAYGSSEKYKELGTEE